MCVCVCVCVSVCVSVCLCVNVGVHEFACDTIFICKLHIVIIIS